MKRRRRRRLSVRMSVFVGVSAFVGVARSGCQGPQTKLDAALVVYLVFHRKNGMEPNGRISENTLPAHDADNGKW